MRFSTSKARFVPVTSGRVISFERWSLVLLLATGAMISLSGCGGGASSKTPVSPVTGSPVLVGSVPGSLPTPPAQGKVNRYAGIDVVANGGNWNWRIAQTDKTYNYQAQQGVSSASASVTSSGVFTTFGDFDFLSDTTNPPATFSGLNAEISGGVAIFEQAFGGFPTGPAAIGVVQQQTGCLAPYGTVATNFLVVPANPQTIPYHPAKDALYGYADLTYKNGTFSYSNVAQLASGGASASEQTIPFADGYCIQAEAGYGIESTSVKTESGTENLLTYIGTTGQLVSVSNHVSGLSATNTPLAILGMVAPKSPVDLGKVTAGSYRGIYTMRSPASQYADPAYFGIKSAFVSSPVFEQSGTSLVGGYEDFYTLLFTDPAPTVTGNILIDFGAQDTSHPGLFPSATFTEPDPSNLCKAQQQSVGSDGQVYCTFPVIALIGESYGKYIVYIAGPEPTTDSALFYGLVQD